MLLADTNVVLWLAETPAELSSRARQAIESARTQGHSLAISATTLWEFALLAAKGHLAFFPSIDVFLAEVEARYRVLPLTRHIALAASRFTGNFPKDPADRIIAATALVHGMPLITADKAIRASGEVPTIW